MPVHLGHDAQGNYAQWGNAKKYFYPSPGIPDQAEALRRAGLQGAAAHAHGYHEN